MDKLYELINTINDENVKKYKHIEQQIIQINERLSRIDSSLFELKRKQEMVNINLKNKIDDITLKKKGIFLG